MYNCTNVNKITFHIQESNNAQWKYETKLNDDNKQYTLQHDK